MFDIGNRFIIQDYRTILKYILKIVDQAESHSYLQLFRSIWKLGKLGI